jgi:hypothetical protein
MLVYFHAPCLYTGSFIVYTIFQKSMFQKGDMKQVPYSGPINIRWRSTKFSRPVGTPM